MVLLDCAPGVLRKHAETLGVCVSIAGARRQNVQLMVSLQHPAGFEFAKAAACSKDVSSAKLPQGTGVGYHELKAAMRALMLPARTDFMSSELSIKPACFSALPKTPSRRRRMQAGLFQKKAAFLRAV